MSEEDVQRIIIDYAIAAGYLVYHTWDSRRSQPGFPDLVLVRGLCVVFIECKAEKGKVTPDQAAWLQKLGQAKYVGVYEARPSNLDDVLEALRTAKR
jgi:hypothetical protein